MFRTPSSNSCLVFISSTSGLGLSFISSFSVDLAAKEMDDAYVRKIRRKLCTELISLTDLGSLLPFHVLDVGFDGSFVMMFVQAHKLLIVNPVAVHIP